MRGSSDWRIEIRHFVNPHRTDWTCSSVFNSKLTSTLSSCTNAVRCVRAPLCWRMNLCGLMTLVSCLLMLLNLDVDRLNWVDICNVLTRIIHQLGVQGNNRLFDSTWWNKSLVRAIFFRVHLVNREVSHADLLLRLLDLIKSLEWRLLLDSIVVLYWVLNVRIP